VTAPPGRYRPWCNTALCALVLGCVYLRFEFKATMDLMPTYLAAEFAAQKNWSHVYHPEAFIPGDRDPAWSRRLRELRIKNHGTSFTSHPYYLTLARPAVALLDAKQFRQAATLANFLLVLWIALQTSWLVGLCGLRGQLLATLLVGLATPVTLALYLGQNTLAALAFSLAAARAWSGGAPVWVGSLLAAGAVLCKPWCLLLLGLCALLRGLKPAALSAAAYALVLGVLPHALYPQRIMRDYLALTAELGRLSLVAPNNHAILATLDRFAWSDWVPELLAGGVRHPALGLRLAAMAIALAIGALALVPLVRARRQQSWVIACGLALMVVPLGVSWNHYFAFALPLALLMALGSHRAVATRLLGFLLLALLVALDDLINPFIALTRRGGLSSELLALLSGLPIVVLSTVAVAAAWLAPREQLESAAGAGQHA
jgi:hypothetical protein